MVRFGNAPLQGCDWKAVLNQTGADRVAQFYQMRGLPVEACDLRMFVAERNLMGRVVNLEIRKETDDTVSIDLGRDSLLAGLEVTEPNYRVSEYDARRTESFHS